MVGLTTKTVVKEESDKVSSLRTGIFLRAESLLFTETIHLSTLIGIHKCVEITPKEAGIKRM